METHWEISQVPFVLMICTLINHLYHHMPWITFIFLDWKRADPPHPALICTDGTLCLKRTCIWSHHRKRGAKGETKLRFVAKLLSLRSPCTFHQFTKSLHCALMFVFLFRKLQRTPRPLLKVKVCWILNVFAWRFSIFSMARQYVCARVNSQAILKAVAWQVLLIKP